MNTATSLELVRDVAVLYVDPRGPYPELVEHWYGEERDARTYDGPHPVVAHPPCGAYGSLRHLRVPNRERRDDADCGPIAVAQVRKWGGVLEQPRGSKLWEACGLPAPGALPDAHGGYSLEVAQCDWGHVARKKTWLYLVSVPLAVLGTAPPRREPTHWVSGGRLHDRKGQGGIVPPGIKVCSAQQRRRTPRAFAAWLVSLAQYATPAPGPGEGEEMKIEIEADVTHPGEDQGRRDVLVLTCSDGANVRLRREVHRYGQGKAHEYAGLDGFDCSCIDDVIEALTKMRAALSEELPYIEEGDLGPECSPEEMKRRVDAAKRFLARVNAGETFTVSPSEREDKP